MSFQAAIDNGLISPISLQEIQDTEKEWKGYGNSEVLGVVTDSQMSAIPFWCLLRPVFDKERMLICLDGQRPSHFTSYFAWQNIIQLWDIRKVQTQKMPEEKVEAILGREYLQAIGARGEKVTEQSGANVGINIAAPQYKVNAMGVRIHCGWDYIPQRGSYGNPQNTKPSTDKSKKPTMELMLLPNAADYAPPAIKPQMRMEQHIKAQQRIDRMSYEELNRFLINYP
jgi:hypothetical protein